MLIASLLIAASTAAPAPGVIALACREELTQTDGYGVSQHHSYQTSYVLHWAEGWLTYQAPWGSGTLSRQGPGVRHFADTPQGHVMTALVRGPGDYRHDGVTRFSPDWRHATLSSSDWLHGREIKRDSGTLNCSRQ